MKERITQRSFMSWLRKQPEEREFQYSNTSHCMLCEFIRETKDVESDQVRAGGVDVHFVLKGKTKRITIKIPKIIADATASSYPLTVGNVKKAMRRKVTLPVMFVILYGSMLVGPYDSLKEAEDELWRLQFSSIWKVDSTGCVKMKNKHD